MAPARGVVETSRMGTIRLPPGTLRHPACRVTRPRIMTVTIRLRSVRSEVQINSPCIGPVERCSSARRFKSGQAMTKAL